MTRQPTSAASRSTGHRQEFRRRAGAARHRFLVSSRARSTRCSARTAPASRRWSRSSTASIRPAPSPAPSRLDGQPVTLRLARRSAGAGIGYVPQEIEVLEQLSVAENVFAGHTGLGDGVLVHQRRLEERAACDLFAISASTSIRGRYVASLTSAQRHLVMIARALALKPRVLMLDEPTASLSGTEVEALFGVLRRLQGAGRDDDLHHPPAAGGAGGLRPRHGAARRPRGGRDRRATISTPSASSSRCPASACSGCFPTHAAPVGAPTVLEVRHLTVAGHAGADPRRQDISFSVAAGEIVGLAGLLGSGRSEILHGIYGRVAADGRDAWSTASQIAIRSPARCPRRRHRAPDRGPQARRPAVQPAGRRQHHHRQSRALVPQRHGARRTASARAIRDAMRALNVKASSPQASVAHLSGGNQQKLLFARVLMRAPRVLLLDEPTKGVDAGTRHEIYRPDRRAGREGRGVGRSSPPSSRRSSAFATAASSLPTAASSMNSRRGEGGEERVLRSVAAAQAQRQRAGCQASS